MALIEDLDKDVWDCPACGEEYDSRRSMATHYGLRDDEEHEGSISGYLVECDNCSKQFRKRTENFDVSENDFCTQKCNNEWKHSNAWREDHTGPEHHNWSGGSVTITCDYCGEEDERKPAMATRSQNRFCDRQCWGNWASENLYGPKAPNWKGGVSSVYSQIKHSLSRQRWHDIAAEVRERADHECEMCGVDGWSLRKSLHAHHLVPLMAGGTNEEWNLMALCPTCHKKAEKKAREYSEYCLTAEYYEPPEEMSTPEGEMAEI